MGIAVGSHIMRHNKGELIIECGNNLNTNKFFLTITLTIKENSDV